MSMTNILPEKEGAQVSLYDIILYNQWQCGGSVKEDNLFIVYRDKDGQKKVHRITDPAMEIYFVKPEFRSQFRTSREYLPMDQVYPAKVPAKQVLQRIYAEMKDVSDPVTNQLKRIYQTALDTQQYNSRKEIYKWPYTLMSDMKLEEYYWCHLGYHYDLVHGHVTDKVFADIENDIYGLTSAQQNENLDPVNAVTLIFGFDSIGPNKGRGIEVHTYLLRNHKRYPQQKDFEDRLSEFYQECHNKFDEQTVIKNGKVKVIKTPATYEIHMCDREDQLLKEVFGKINKEKPDICEFWNMPYDMPKMRSRMELLGMDPVSVMSDSDYFPPELQFAQFHIDNRPIDIANRNSYIRMTSTTQYVDQMQNYAGIRKGRKAYGSNKLDNIANIELGMGKLKFGKGVDVTNACIKDYWRFVLYNIRDVWCQYLIDLVTNDTMSIIVDMNQQNCPIYHLFKQTKYQKYIYYTQYMKRGYIPGNNVNTNYTRFGSEEEQERVEEALKRKRLRAELDKMGIDEDDIDEIMSDPEALADFGLSYDEEVDDQDESIEEIATDEVEKVAEKSLVVYEDSIDRKLSLPGGLVGNPDFNSANGTELIPGIHSKHVFDDAMDQDYASMYPWAKFTRSITRSTQIGRLVIEEKVSDMQNRLPLGQQKRPQENRAYIPGAEFTSDYLSGDWLMFGQCWFNLPSTEEMSKILEEQLKKEGD